MINRRSFVTGLLATPFVIPALAEERITFVQGFAPGNVYDIYSRLLAKHMEKYLKKPIIVENMVGGGTIVAGNYLYNRAARNGTVIGMLAETVALKQLEEDRNVHFDARYFNYIGRMDPTITLQIVKTNTGVQSVEDIKKIPILIGGYGPGTPADMIPRILNEQMGTQYTVVSYRSPQEALLAMEADDIQAMSLSWYTLRTNRSNWLKENKVKILLQATYGKYLPNIPTILDICQSRATEAQAIAGDIGISVLSPPALTDQTLAQLRKAFTTTMSDSEFIKAADKADITLNYLRGQDVQLLVNRLFE